ncbi:MAG: translation initiation factor IF-1 [Myxococcota bacterium]
MTTDGSTETLDGVIEEQLPNALYRVRLENGQTVRCNVSGKAKLKIIKLLAGDAVTVEVSRIDTSRGRIVDAS